MSKLAGFIKSKQWRQTSEGKKKVSFWTRAESVEFENGDTLNETIDNINTSLDGKAPSSHTHSKADITDFPSSLPANGGTADSAKTADSVAWENVSGKPNSYLPSTHNHDDRYYTETEVNNLLNSKQDANTAINTSNISSQSVSYANSAGNADTVDGQHFNWSGQGGQPTWLWGGNDYGNMYVYNPANFSVNYADSAGSANGVTPEWAGSIEWANTAWISAWTNDGTKIKALAKTSFAPSTHYHDDRYYTETEVDSKIDNLAAIKANRSHNHSGDTLYPNGLQVKDGWLDWVKNGSIAFHIWCDNSQTFMRNGAGGAIYLRASGNVGIKNTDDTAWAAVFASEFVQQSSRLVKENINPIDEKEAEKLLLLNPVSFDYKENFGGNKGLFGLIAEETLDIIPSCVLVPDDYSEENFDEEKGINQPVLAIDYSKLVPHLIKMIQIHEKRIAELEAEIKELKSSIN